VRQLYEKSGARTWASFARKAAVSELSLGEWRRGEGMPDAINLLRMLAAAGYELPPDVVAGIGRE
jgi:hypothetical protein